MAHTMEPGAVQRLRWLQPVREVFESEPGGGCRRQGRHPQRWAKQVVMAK